MYHGLDQLKNEAKALKRFRYLKISGGFLAYFAFSFFLIFVLIILQLDDMILYAFFSAVISFLIGFVFMVFHVMTSKKKEIIFQKLLFEYLWQPIIVRNTFDLKNDYFLTNEKSYDGEFIHHPMIPSRASESYEYELQNISKQLKMVALLAYTRSTNGQGGSSTSTYFRGYACETNIDVQGLLYIRKNAWYQKITANFNEFSKYKVIDDLMVNGDYTEELKLIRNKVMSFGFEEVSLINHQQKLMILIHKRTFIPPMKQYNQETYDKHEAFLMNLVNVMEYIATL